MATINDIPLHLLKRILFLAAGFTARNLGHWKQKLPIIGVCHLWRDIGLKLVYNQVMFYDNHIFSTRAKTERRITKRYYIQHGTPYTEQIIFSNFDLLVMLDRCYLARDMLIFVHRYGSHSLVLDKLYKLFQMSRGDWLSVSHLSVIEYEFSDRGTESTIISINNNNYDLMPLVNYFKAKISNLCFIHNNASDNLMSSFVAQLNSELIDTLYGLQSDMSYLCRLSYLPLHITILNLTFDKSDKILKLPIILANKLEYLVLKNLPSGFDWTCFQNPIVPYYTNVTFFHLRWLRVFYKADYNNKGYLVCDKPNSHDKLRIKLVFPRLKHLLIRECSRSNSILYSKFLNIIDEVRYLGSISSIALCQQINTKAAKLYISITSADKHEESIFYTTTNALLADKNKKTEAIFNLESIYFTINIDFLKWNNLSNLNMDFCIDFKSFVFLMQSLSYLKMLIVRQDSINSLVDTLDYCLLHGFERTVDYVLSRNVEIVIFNGEFSPYQCKEMLDLVKFTMAYCINLKSLHVDFLLKDDIQEFIDKYNKDISHLRNINIDFPVSLIPNSIYFK